MFVNKVQCPLRTRVVKGEYLGGWSLFFKTCEEDLFEKLKKKSSPRNPQKSLRGRQVLSETDEIYIVIPKRIVSK